jgi:hypothetical protein
MASSPVDLPSILERFIQWHDSWKSVNKKLIEHITVLSNLTLQKEYFDMEHSWGVFKDDADMKRRVRTKQEGKIQSTANKISESLSEQVR